MRRNLWRGAVVVVMAAALASGCKRKAKHETTYVDNTPEPRLRLLGPNGGESWLIGTSQTVLWTPADAASPLMIEYSTDGASWTALATATANDGNQSVTVPADPSSTVRIRVTETDSGTNDSSDSTLSFVSGGPPPEPLTVLTPNGGESWAIGSTQTVAWMPSDPASPVDIEVTTDGSTWTPLATATVNDGSESVTVPSTPSATVRIRVTETASGINDASDAEFSLAGILVTSPNGSETWVTSQPAVVTWIAAGFPGMVDVHYSTDGVTWLPLVLATPNDGTQAISVPLTPSTTSRVRVSEAAPGLADSSDGDFSIQILFEDIGAGLPGVVDCSLAWGDYDNDGDLDLAMAGDSGGGARVSRIYQNVGGVFTDISAGLTGVDRCSLAWGDYDNDGDLDLALAGSTGTPNVTRLYRNDGAGVFTSISAGFIGVRSCSLAWGDYDNDGDLDLALAGYSSGGIVSRIYRNGGAAVFTDIGAGLIGATDASLAWGDYDSDGDLDLAVAGDISGVGYVSLIYQNAGGVFTDIGAGMPGLSNCFQTWGDYDNDGDLDLASAGFTISGWITSIYQNSGGVFTDIGAGLAAVYACSLAWGDYDNDGDLDLALAGANGGTSLSRVYRNDSAGVFTDISASLADVGVSSAAWGDFDNDGDLDLALAGSVSGGSVMRIYRNNVDSPDAAPSAPSGLSATPGAGTVALSWTAPADDFTPAAGLNYNLRVGTAPGAADAYSSMANASSGYRRIAAQGPLQTTSATLSLPSGTYFWSVQAVDTARAGSAWATEGTFTIP